MILVLAHWRGGTLVGAVGACDVRPALRVWCGGQCGDFGACRRDELAVGVGLTMQAPTTVRCLGEEHPRPVGYARITGGASSLVSSLVLRAACPEMMLIDPAADDSGAAFDQMGCVPYASGEPPHRLRSSSTGG